MFSASRKQLAHVDGVTIRPKDLRQKDPNNLIEFVIRIPIDRELVDEIMPALARDLYEDDGSMRPEVGGLSPVFTPPLSMQTVTAFEHPDLSAFATYSNAQIRDPYISRGADGESFVLTFKVGWIFKGVKAELALISKIKRGSLYLSMAPEQGDLLADERKTETGEPAAAKTGPKAVEKPKTRRGRKQPEAEAQQQIQEGQARAANDDHAGDAIAPGEELRPGVAAM